jgi:hypothetical protein
MKTLTNITLSLILLVASVAASAQTRFVVQNGENSQVFGTFAAALAATQAGDTLYLPAGTFSIGNVYIDHRLTLVGVGHYPEYTTAAGITWLNGSIYLRTGADHSLLQGFYLTGDIRFGTNTATQNVNNITISRCNVGNIQLYASGTATAEQILISENVVRGTIIGGDAQNVLIEKNLAHNIQSFNNNVLIANNIIFKPTGDTFNYLFSCLIQNNIILHTGSYLFYGSTSNTIVNNLFVRDFAMPGSNNGSGNIGNQPLNTIFVNFEGSTFGYEFNFNLQQTSPGKNAATDGNDIGIYGTVIPYKEGAVPFNPNITFQQISTITNEEGNIEVEVNVSAQER